MTSPRVLDLCCGTGSIGKAVRRMFPGSEVVSVDMDPAFKPTIVGDITKLDYKALWKPREFTHVWGSPPCTQYSIARSTGGPRDFALADSIAAKVWEIIAYLRPDTFFIENPGSGHMHRRKFMQKYERFRKRTSYCHYGTKYRKLTDIWTNADVDLKCCSAETPCRHLKDNNHPVTAQKGPSMQSVVAAGSVTSTALYVVPYKLLKKLLMAPASGTVRPLWSR